MYFKHKLWIISGTIEEIELWNRTNGMDVSLGVFNVPDRFNANLFRISLPFPDVS